MKKTISFLLAAMMLLTGTGCSDNRKTPEPVKTAGADTSEPAVTTMTGAFDHPEWDLSKLLDLTDDYPDKLYSSSEENAELLVFRTGNDYFTYSLERTMAGWTGVYSGVPEEMNMTDGSFELITADITRYTGGVAGYMGAPDIRKLKSAESMTLAEAAEYCGMERYVPGEPVYNEPLLCGEYLVINFHDDIRVYRDGQLIGKYGTQPEAEAAMGLRVIPDSSVEMERLGKYYLYVFRSGDQYLSYCPHIGMNSCWTPYINSRFGNEPEAFILEDGESAYIHSAEIIKLNGGNAGYVNVPMVMNDEDYEKVGYDIISDRMPPYWGVFRSGKYEDTDGNSKDRAEFSDTCNAMFDRDVSGTWLIFYIDGKYRVYLDDHEDEKQIGIYDTPEEVNALFR